MQRTTLFLPVVLSLSSSAAACSPASDADQSEPPPAEQPVTWHQGIAGLVRDHCVGCHTTGGAAPFSLDGYAQARPWAQAMLAQVEAGLMPPWGAVDTEECVHPAAFEHDPRLNAEDHALLVEWMEAGAPEGDPDAAHPLPEPPDLDLADPDGVFRPPGAFEVDGDEDLFWCTSIDPGIGQDAWLTGLQLRPGSASVVHHVLFYEDPTGASAELGDDNGYFECFGGAGVEEATLIGGYVPGALPLRPPPETGIPLPAGARIIMSFHYHPTGAGRELDRSTLALEWTTQPPRYEAGFELVGNAANAEAGLLPGPNDPEEGPAFVIPANAEGHVERMQWTVPDLGRDLYLWSIANHMHYIGVDQLTQLEHANGDRECMLHTPQWDFDWQRVYEFDGALTDMPRLSAGETLQLRCTYDNTLQNPAVAQILEEQGMDAPVDVHLGDRSTDEMCIAAISYAYER